LTGKIWQPSTQQIQLETPSGRCLGAALGGAERDN
jgi:hypothetical protein